MRRVLQRSAIILGILVTASALFIMGFVELNEEGKYALSKEEMAKASDIYFNTCAGCHGTTRKGATGPSLLPDRIATIPDSQLFQTIMYGKPGGMPDWGRQGVLSKDEINLMIKFLHNEPPAPPEMSMEQMYDTWKVYVEPQDRPKKPEHNRNWKNFMGVILRDVGKVAIIDGDTKELVSIVNTGFAVHILRSSATGRYFYSIGRDGKVTMIDLWMKKPDKVAEIKVAYDARSVESSKYKGPEGDFLDKYVVVGGYWPPHLVILDGQTLEPLKIISTSSYTYDDNEFMRETRVASIVASHFEPSWIVNLKEAGIVWIVNYKNLDKGRVDITALDAEKFLHDGGWDLTKRYFLVAANAMNRIVAVDAKEKVVSAIIPTGNRPHPGRGATLKHPQYGNLWLTGHLGDNTIACITTPTDGNGTKPWQVVKKIHLPGKGGGNLFIKTHPKSPHIWADRPLNPDPKLQRSVFVIDKNSLEVIKTIEIPKEFPGRAVHLEYNKAGDEVWVSVWGTKHQSTAILIYDDKTLTLKKTITGDWVRTPTGHFNVYNTVHDIY